MKEIKETIRENLIFFRKKFKLTQIELAAQLGYSDKAVSRWEKGEVIPEVLTLEKLSKLYNIPLTAFFEEHKGINKPVVRTRLLSFLILSILVCWSILLVLYIWLIWRENSHNVWQLFILGVPVSSIIVIYFNKRFYHNKLIFLFFSSAFVWTTITTVCAFMNFRAGTWLFYLIGIPIEAMLATIYILRKEEKIN